MTTQIIIDYEVFITNCEQPGANHTGFIKQKMAEGWQPLGAAQTLLVPASGIQAPGKASLMPLFVQTMVKYEELH